MQFSLWIITSTCLMSVCTVQKMIYRQKWICKHIYPNNNYPRWTYTRPKYYKVSGEPGISIGYCRFTQFNVKNCVPNDAVYTIHLSCTKGFCHSTSETDKQLVCIVYACTYTHILLQIFMLDAINRFDGTNKYIIAYICTHMLH